MGVPPVARAAERGAAMVIDANTGAVLHDQSGDEQRYPASLTKMMTLYLAFEEIERGSLSYESRLTVSAAAAGVAPSKLRLKVGEDIALIDAMKALVTKSANDMAIAVAERIAGSERAFARRMTERAHAIGMKSTVFRNASGLPDPAQLTTARDMLTLGMRLQEDFPEHYKLFSMRSFTYRGKAYKTHNTLMAGYPGMDGIKTGYTRSSGFNLVSSVRRDGKWVVGAVFGGVSASVRNAHMRMIMFHAMEKASTERTRMATPVLIARKSPATKEAVAAKEPPKVPQAAAKKRDTETHKIALAAKAPTAQAALAPQPALKPSLDAATTSTKAPAAAPSPLLQPTVSQGNIQIAKVRAVDVTAPDRSLGQQVSVSPPAPVVAMAEAAAASPMPLVSADTSPSFDFSALRNAFMKAREARAAAAAVANEAAAPVQHVSVAAPTPVAEAQEEAATQPSLIAGSGEEPALGRVPSTLDAQRAQFGTGPQPTVVTTITPESSNQYGTAVSVRPPATLTAQATQLAAASPPPSVVLRGTDAAPAPIEGRAYEIQIGAFPTETDAEAQIAAAKTKAGKLLTGHSGVARAVQKGPNTIYRARFAGFDEPKASATCSELRRKSIDCFVMKRD